MYKHIRPFLFLFSPETAHYLTTSILKSILKIPGTKNLLSRFLAPKNMIKPTRIMGLDFSNKIGMAAGFDKDGKYIDELTALGFGFIEVGTVTPKAQAGNEKPRLFRLPKDQALLNRMGFNNDGASELASRLKKIKKKGIIIGGNIGKNKSTPNELAVEDYLSCFETLHPFVDYFVINVSSPNTPGLRELQEKEPLRELMFRIVEFNRSKTTQRPVLLKIAPDLSFSQLDDILDIVRDTGIEGIVATNTTLNREHLRTSSKILSDIGSGGLSGKPLFPRALEIVRYLRANSSTDLVIIGVGGIMSATDAVKMKIAGASLVQVYTGFIYQGPSLVRSIARAMD
jgi:dihydroorotate dehydrogenase